MKYTEAQIRQETIWVPMRDGIRLATEVFWPPVSKGPCIAVRTPYRRLRNRALLLQLACHGYIVLCQDVRGTGDSEPDGWEFYIYEYEDSVDFVEWIAQQGWFGSFLSSLGGSYVGGTQWCMAMHPRMSAIAPEVAGLGTAPSNGVRFHMYLNAYTRSIGKGAGKVAMDIVEMERLMHEETLATGFFEDVLEQPFTEGLIARYPMLTSMSPGEARRWLWQHYNTLPAAERVELLKIGLDEEIVTFDTTTRINLLFPHWVDPDALYLPRRSVQQLYEALKAPAFLKVGWYDWCLGDVLHTWEQLTRYAAAHVRENSRLVITPAAHNAPGYREGMEEHPALVKSYRSDDNLEALLAWYAAAQEGTIRESPAVTYYLMAANEWRIASAWPPPEVATFTLYLAQNGELASSEPPVVSTPDSYSFDPLKPTPTVGGSIVSNIYTPGSADVSEVQRRSDVLSYTTEILPDDLDVVGHLRLVLYARSSAPDTDFYGRLSDVFPDGRALQLQNGMVRARYRAIDGEPSLLERETVYRLEIDMWATANRFAAGHRLRLDISSADFPKFGRNNNRGGPGSPLIAHQTIFHDRSHPSHLLLPVLHGAEALMTATASRA